MAYELWSTDTRNIVGDYETEDAALMVVSNARRTQGRAAVVGLVLGYENRHGQTQMIAAGDELIALAEAAAPGLDVKK